QPQARDRDRPVAGAERRQEGSEEGREEEIAKDVTGSAWPKGFVSNRIARRKPVPETENGYANSSRDAAAGMAPQGGLSKRICATEPSPTPPVNAHQFPVSGAGPWLPKPSTGCFTTRSRTFISRKRKSSRRSLKWPRP